MTIVYTLVLAPVGDLADRPRQAAAAEVHDMTQDAGPADRAAGAGAVLLAVLAVRLWQVQVVRGPELVNRATETRTRVVIVPAVRGPDPRLVGPPAGAQQDRAGRLGGPDRPHQDDGPGGGRCWASCRRCSAGRSRTWPERITPCGPGVPKPCWTGSPYQPIPLDEKVDTREALQILERQEEFPGVTAEIQAVREYPGGGPGAQVLGYLQPVTAGRAGEAAYGLKASVLRRGPGRP